MSQGWLQKLLSCLAYPTPTPSVIIAGGAPLQLTQLTLESAKTNFKRHGEWTSDATVEGYIAQSRPLRLERVNKLQPQDDSSEKELDGIVKDRKTPAKHSGLTQVDHLNSDEEAVLQQDSDGEPIMTIKKRIIEEFLPVHMYYKGGDQTNKKKFRK